MYHLDNSNSAEVTFCEQENRVRYLIFFYCDIHFIATIKEPNLQDKTAVDSQKIKSNESKDTR